MTERENIVVVGGGGAGTSITRQLSEWLNRSQYNLILISPRSYMVHYPATLRMLVTSKGHLEDCAFIPLEQIFINGHGRLVNGKVVSIKDDGENGGHITLDNGETIKWSILVLAPGRIWRGPLAFPEPKAECLDHVYEWRRKFEQAKNIVLVGGGAVGIELAGELKEFHPNKNVTIVHGQELPLNDYYPRRWRKDIARRLRRRGVNLVLSDYVDDEEIEHYTIKTRNGEVVLADLVVPCGGAEMNTEFIGTLGEGTLWSSKCVRIDTAFRLLHHKRIFAAGDVIEWEEQKQLCKAYTHAEMVSKNVMAALRKEDPAAIYKGSAEIMCLSMGQTGGTTYYSYLWGFNFGDAFTMSLKGRDLMVGQAREKCGIRHRM
ncbi:hypothetical protein AMATHDRAFT_157112 [Amanita thiersii Skay4041]|uniref:FAD/NAD(P)-binding domain-containing protein n=1 Tax=Amanita thiersii Skay4041 TaxID=703135 RepID=A0A2A9NE20_9AGAR|nr:hypothetical protein AMATHDRAFT_157112 [Amanita thiersii Skay4041]